MNVTLPYHINFGQYGSLVSLYQWYVKWYQYPTNTSTILSTATATIKSSTSVTNGMNVTISIYNINNISRVGTSGYVAPTFTYYSTPIFTLYNSVLDESIEIYNTSISTSVAAGSSGETTTGSIVHDDEVIVFVPSYWFDSANYEHFSIKISETVLISDTSVSQINATTSTEFAFLSPATFTYSITWINDSNNIYNTRPSDYKIDIYDDGILYDTISINGSGNVWSGSVQFLIKGTCTSSNHDDIYNYSDSLISTDLSFEVENTLYTTSYESPLVEWLDNNNVFNKRPTDINTILLKGGEEFSSTITSDGNYTWTNLPQKDFNGNIYPYSNTYEIEGYCIQNDGKARLIAGKKLIGNKLAVNLYRNSAKNVFLGDALFLNYLWLLSSNINYSNILPIWEDTEAWNDSLYFIDSVPNNAFYNIEDVILPLCNIPSTVLKNDYKLITTDKLYK